MNDETRGWKEKAAETQERLAVTQDLLADAQSVEREIARTTAVNLRRAEDAEVRLRDLVSASQEVFDFYLTERPMFEAMWRLGCALDDERATSEP